MADWLTRYRNGGESLVWHELRSLGDRVRQPENLAAAQAVCNEMARRARRNIEVLVGRLSAQGYQFHDNDMQDTPVVPFVPASPGAALLVDWLEDHFGPLPMTMASWMRLVGDVWLVGTHPDWPESREADPLVLEFEYSRYPGADARSFYQEDHDAWRASEGTTACPFGLPVAPDRLTKANVSGGPPYTIPLPDAGADGRMLGESTTGFVDYLNTVFQNGGFSSPPDGQNGRRVVDSLRGGMLTL